MPKFSSIIAVAFAGLILSGCASSPWNDSATSPAGLNANAATSPVPPAPADPQQVQNVMAEVQQTDMLDPVAEDQLREDLRQSDPSLWPLVIQQFRATQAYRRRAMERSGVLEVQRLPVPNDSVPTQPPLETPSFAAYPPYETETPSNPVGQTTYAAPVSLDWRQQLAGAIRALETETSGGPDVPTEAARRAEEAKSMLAESMAKLAESAPLAIRNIAVCTEVRSYGCAKRFDKYEFAPNQEVLLYIEVENFASEPTPKGYHTSMHSCYQIFDSNGNKIFEQKFLPTEEFCQNLRRDFFIGYHLRLPKQIGPGNYTLHLSIEDMKSRKIGQASLDLSIKE